jgi:hypothetical protein
VRWLMRTIVPTWVRMNLSSNETFSPHRKSPRPGWSGTTPAHRRRTTRARHSHGRARGPTCVSSRWRRGTFRRAAAACSCLHELARLQLDTVAKAAALPDSKMIPATYALRFSLALKEAAVDGHQPQAGIPLGRRYAAAACSAPPSFYVRHTFFALTQCRRVSYAHPLQGGRKLATCEECI